MQSKRIVRLVSSAACLALSAAMASAQLYAASGSNGVGGSLYTINQANGAVLTTVGALHDANGSTYGMTGMAFLGGTLYGAISNASPTDPGWLVTINTTNALVTPIGAFGVGAMSDIDVNGGTMFGWHASGDHSLYSINTGTGAATLVGLSGNPGFGGGGLASNNSGAMFVSPNATSNPPGSLYSVNPITGAITLIGAHTGNTLGPINSMEFIGSVMYGIESNQSGSPTTTQLVTINTSTAAVTELGQSAGDLDALAFRAVPEPASLTALALGALVLIRRRRSAK